ncbi:bolA-like protein DDB_G0274169 [Daphnia magna]|uniref:bolA-like protein DDB_G0274169 n=1 Tax=Daphnia magna TaxID=35525 RepID=UPI001E1B9F9F|nr:bolA-like protein DDB_G0274169 [Daphnia magna]
MLVRSLRVFGLYHPAQSFSGSKTMATIPVKNGNPMELLIRDKLVRQFSPVHLDIINESYMHNVPKGSETHFKVVVVSDKFENTSLLQRHRLVNEILQNELKNGVHALSIVAKTPSQWEDSSKVTEKSPACKGGFGR